MSAPLQPTPNLDKRFGIAVEMMPSPVASTEEELCIATDVGYNFGLPTSSLPTEIDKCTGLQLKEALEVIEGLPCDTQQLSFRGRPIQDGDLLGQIGVVGGSQLLLELADQSVPAPSASIERDDDHVITTSSSRHHRNHDGKLDAAQLEELERLEELARNIALSPTGSKD
eukprot:SAG31_NODE_8059_length_1531_cov_1.099162_1_plen_169_part_10